MNMNQGETKRAAQEGDLPPLPRPHSVEQIRIKSDGYKLDARFTADQMREYARLALAAAGGGVPQGYKLVPVEPTAEMWAAVNKLDDEMAAGGYDGKGCTIEQAWECLLASSPQPEAAQAAPSANAGVVKVCPLHDAACAELPVAIRCSGCRPAAAPSAGEVERGNAEYLCKQIDAIRKDVRVVLKQYNDPYAAIDLMAHRIKDAVFDAALSHKEPQR